jgi:predicted methyltransferase
VTFHFNPGKHSFTDVGFTGASKKALVIDVKDGGQYCVRLFARMINLEVYGQWDNQIQEVPCQQARLEATHLKPIEVKRVDPAVRAELDSQTTFPDVIQPQH